MQTDKRETVMKKIAKYLLSSVLAFCCILGLTACGGNEQKTYIEGRFTLSNYELHKDGQKADASLINNNTVGSTNQYFIELDSEGNMKIVCIDISVSVFNNLDLKYNLFKSDEKTYTYHINSSNKIVVKDGNKTILYNITIDESNTVITLKSTLQTGNAQVISKFEITA